MGRALISGASTRIIEPVALPRGHRPFRYHIASSEDWPEIINSFAGRAWPSPWTLSC